MENESPQIAAANLANSLVLKTCPWVDDDATELYIFYNLELIRYEVLLEYLKDRV